MIKLNHQRVFFTSDTHYNHSNIVNGVSSWGNKQRTRPFKTLEEHNYQLVHNINQTVGQNDVLFHLGDWSFGGFDKIKEFYDRLVCKNIHLILGNHDHHIENNKENIRDLFLSVNQATEISIYGQRIFLSHYAHRVWNKSHKGAWHLYGHSHGTIDNNYGKSMDVGVDVHQHFRPFHMSEIRVVMNKREIIYIDHHNTETN
jgi:calcineurin-like phosphoesterase family protein